MSERLGRKALIGAMVGCRRAPLISLNFTKLMYFSEC